MLEQEHILVEEDGLLRTSVSDLGHGMTGRHRDRRTNKKGNKSEGLAQWQIQTIVLAGGGERVWDAVDASPKLGGQNVLKTFAMAIQHNRRPTRTELE